MPEGRPRARDLGIGFGRLPTGPTNSLVDVPGVRVGHRTLWAPPRQLTGVTAVLPHDGPAPLQPLPAGLAVGNGFGKLIGATQIAETGLLESPILLTNTLAAFRVADALVRHVLALPGCGAIRSFNPVVGETNDGLLNDIRDMGVVGEADVAAAIADAHAGRVAEGCVGAGTGTMAFGWKGGIGSASRRVARGWTLGVLVQANFGGSLRIGGVAVGERLPAPGVADAPPGSIMILVGTDAPLDSAGLTRLARRALMGIARTGGFMAHGSGDYALAFGVAAGGAGVTGNALDPLFEAAVDATEEAIVNALFAAVSVEGHRGRAEAIPAARVAEMVRAAG